MKIRSSLPKGFANWPWLVIELLSGIWAVIHRALNNYYHYTRRNDKLPSLKRSFSRAKRQSADCKWNLQPATWFNVAKYISYEINFYDLALYIDTNDYHMTFGGHIVYLCPDVASFATICPQKVTYYIYIYIFFFFFLSKRFSYLENSATIIY